MTNNDSLSGMNPAVRAIVRMGIYLGCKVYFIHEVGLLNRSDMPLDFYS